MPAPDNIALARTWISAIAQPVVRSGLEDVYATTAAEITARAPACWASGRCCNFAKSGHRLYVTGLEAAYLVARLAETPALLRNPPPLGSAPTLLPILTKPVLSSPLSVCPFLSGNLCTVHAIKPLACRTYFCDAAARDWQTDLTERMLARIRALHDDHAVTYRYAEWGHMLSTFSAV